jgi:hypothetical protein
LSIGGLKGPKLPFLEITDAPEFSSSSDGVPDLDSMCISKDLCLGPPNLKPLTLEEPLPRVPFKTKKSLGRESIFM